jgi:hypothetical protein
VLDRIVREQAFTILNRFAALRMMEARGILLESVAKGYQSRGFQLYQRVANGALGETGEAYCYFLFSVFDTFAADLPALFDRHAPQGHLFPRAAALLAVLKEFDAPDLEPLWGEDETIGWIYQYFNSKEERQAMRKATQPRAIAGSSPCATSSSPRAMWWNFSSTTRSAGSGSTGPAGSLACTTAVNICWRNPTIGLRLPIGCATRVRSSCSMCLRVDAFRDLRFRFVPGDLPRGVGVGGRARARVARHFNATRGGAEAAARNLFGRGGVLTRRAAADH